MKKTTLAPTCLVCMFFLTVANAEEPESFGDDSLRVIPCEKQRPRIPKLDTGEMLARIHWQLQNSEGRHLVVIDEKNKKNSSITCAVTEAFEVIITFSGDDCRIVTTRDGKNLSWADSSKDCRKIGLNLYPLTPQHQTRISE